MLVIGMAEHGEGQSLHWEDHWHPTSDHVSTCSKGRKCCLAEVHVWAMEKKPTESSRSGVGSKNMIHIPLKNSSQRNNDRDQAVSWTNPYLVTGTNSAIVAPRAAIVTIMTAYVTLHPRDINLLTYSQITWRASLNKLINLTPQRLNGFFHPWFMYPNWSGQAL